VLQFDNLKSLSKSLTVVTVKALMSLMLVLLPVHCKCQCTTYSIKNVHKQQNQQIQYGSTRVNIRVWS